MTIMHMSKSEIEAGRGNFNRVNSNNVWGQVGLLPGYQVGFNNPDIRPMLVRLNLETSEPITISCRAPINDEGFAAFAGYPTEEIVGHIQYGIGGYVVDADFDWLNGNRITVIAQSLQVVARRVNLGAIPGANPGDFQVAAFAGLGAHGSTEATRTVTYSGVGLAPGTAWMPAATPVLIPRLAKTLSVHLGNVQTLVAVTFVTQNHTACGQVRINIPYADDIRIPNGAKFFNVQNAGLLNNTETYMAFIFSLAL